MLKRIHHIGIAVRDLDAAIALYRDQFGVTEWERISLPERHMNVAVCLIGDTMLEFITPTSDDAAFARYLREKGEGMHHIAYEVAEVEDALRTVERSGLRLVDEHARPGIHDTCVAFLHPKSTMGVLIELVEVSHSHE
ncbi:MAG TPA: methylmalonyl-CoA epimerase [Herpetosiphonaceae bacterium]